MKTNLILICLLLVSSCSLSKKENEQEESITTISPDEINKVKALQLEYADFNQELISNGSVTASKKADLRFAISETITDIYVKNGSKVSKGEKIASLDQFKLKNTMLQTIDNLERAKLDLQDVLISQGYSLKDSANIPKEVLKIASVRSNYGNSLVQYQLAQYNLHNAILYAPFDGVVANLVAKEYNIPSASDPFCTILSNSSLEVVAMVLENELPVINIGEKVYVSPFSINDFTVVGQISEINPTIDKNGMVRIKVSIGSNNKLYDGMNVKVRIQRSVNKQLVIPKEALVLRSNKKVVFTLKAGKAMWSYVQTGLENSTSYVVTEGLNVGDSIIYDGNINLAHEAPVQLIK